MKIVMCNGGLGNQTFQYIFARYLELKSREEVWLDDSIFFISKQHNGFEIPRVFPNSKVRLLSSFFDEDVWEYMISNCVKGIGICQQLKDAGEDITMIAETDDFSFDGNIVYVPTNEYLPFVAAAKGNIYYHGYWINRDWLKGKYWSILKDELQFAPLQDERNKKYERQMRDTMSASLHIRRGDFVKFGWASPLIYRMLFNLTENAVKYNRLGGSVRVELAQGQEKCSIRVSDTGCGIPEEYQQSIFHPFFRVDKSRSREYGGAGLGLSLVWEIADLHGGSVWVEESSDKGTTIAVELPAGTESDPSGADIP